VIQLILTFLLVVCQSKTQTRDQTRQSLDQRSVVSWWNNLPTWRMAIVSIMKMAQSDHQLLLLWVLNI